MSQRRFFLSFFLIVFFVRTLIVSFHERILVVAERNGTSCSWNHLSFHDQSLSNLLLSTIETFPGPTRETYGGATKIQQQQQ